MLALRDGDADDSRGHLSITGVGRLDDRDHFLSSRRTTETLRKSVDAPAQRPGCIFKLARGDGRSPGG